MLNARLMRTLLVYANIALADLGVCPAHTSLPQPVKGPDSLVLTCNFFETQKGKGNSGTATGCAVTLLTEGSPNIRLVKDQNKQRVTIPCKWSFDFT